MKEQSNSTEQQCNKQNVIHRLSSYKKLKKENERLRNEIYTLIREPETEKGTILKMQYNIYYDQIDAIMFGSRTTDKPTFGGILSMIAPNEE